MADTPMTEARFETRLDELGAGIQDAEAEFGTDSAEHSAAIDAYYEFVTEANWQPEAG
jgi:hypothetical protein